MKYEIGQLVFVYEENKFKKIIDSELIENIEIYYMSDKTAYPSNKLIKMNELETKESLDDFLLKNRKRILSLINKDVIQENWKRMTSK